MVEEGTTARELIAFAQQTQQAGGMGGYQFHGVDSEFFQVSATAHRRLLAYLKADPDRYQVMTFSDAMKVVTGK